MLEIISWYAIHDPDPAEETINTSVHTRSRKGLKLDVHGFNTNRGRAAQAVRALLDANFERIHRLKPALNSLVSDRAASVRCVAIACLFPLLDHDRDEAISLFRQLSEDEPRTWATLYWEHFLGNACHSHYAELRPLLKKSAQSCVSEVATAGSRRMALGALIHLTEFPDDIPELLQQTTAARVGVADVLAANITNREVGDYCSDRLLGLFDDDAQEVRKEAATCFNKMDNPHLHQRQHVIAKFLVSPAFELERNPLLRALEKCQGQLPEIALEVIKTYLNQATVETGNVSRASAMDSSHVSNITFRIYEQSPDKATRKQCLDLIDRMERLRFYGVTDRLNQVDS
jgi:hypothetical protein